MSVAMMFDIPGVTQEQYEIGHQALGDPLTHGALVHIAGPSEGGWRVIEVWPSAEIAARFFQSELVQEAFRQAGFPPVQPIVFPVYALYPSG